jgi:hypothetical protein
MRKRVHSNKKVLDSDSGQGFVEYLLVLVVTVALFIGLMAQFNKSVEVWLNNYFGEYLACLLETGELPSLGSIDGSGICAQFYSPFRAELDRGDGGSGVGGSGGTQYVYEGSPSESGGTGANTASRGGIESNRSSGSGGGRFTPMSVYRPNATGSSDRFSAGTAAESSTNTGSTAISTPSGLIASSSDGGTFLVPSNQVDLAFWTKKKPGEEKEITLIAAARVEGAGSSQGSKRFLASMNSKPPKDEDGGLDLGFGDYFRYLLIAAIIIAIIVFFGGQILQMSKSMDS